MAGLIFHEGHFFTGVNETDVLADIGEVLGTRGLYEWCNRTGFEIPTAIRDHLMNFDPLPLEEFVKEGYQERVRAMPLPSLPSCSDPQPTGRRRPRPWTCSDDSWSGTRQKGSPRQRRSGTATSILCEASASRAARHITP